MKKICISIIVILLIGILGFYNVVNALTKSELEQKRIELNLKIEEAGKNIENINVELTKNLEEINALDEQIYVYEEQINTLSKNLSDIEKQKKEVEQLLIEVEKEYEYQKRITGDKISKYI